MNTNMKKTLQFLFLDNNVHDVLISMTHFSVPKVIFLQAAEFSGL